MSEMREGFFILSWIVRNRLSFITIIELVVLLYNWAGQWGRVDSLRGEIAIAIE